MSRFRPLALAALAGALLLAACSRGPAPSAEDMTMGDPKAPVKMVEYASASCSHCATFNNTVFPEFKTKYIDTGKVHYTLKEFLTPPNELAAAGFLTARCAGKEKYFTVLDAIFRSQQEIFQTGDMRGVLLRVAQSAGLTEAQFNACITDEEALKALNARVDRAIKQDRITGTPAFFINGKSVGEGEISLAALEKAVAEASK
jgi:protein-disulfide isomerase